MFHRDPIIRDAQSLNIVRENPRHAQIRCRCRRRRSCTTSISKWSDITARGSWSAAQVGRRTAMKWTVTTVTRNWKNRKKFPTVNNRTQWRPIRLSIGDRTRMVTKNVLDKWQITDCWPFGLAKRVFGCRSKISEYFSYSINWHCNKSLGVLEWWSLTGLKTCVPRESSTKLLEWTNKIILRLESVNAISNVPSVSSIYATSYYRLWKWVEIHFVTDNIKRLQILV